MTQTADVSATTRRMIADDFIPARQGGAWLVNRGQHIRVIDVEGGQICDFVCFNGDKLTERFSQARTKANQGKFTISTGDHLYSRDNNVMLTIVEDTYCDHDLQWGMCSAWGSRTSAANIMAWSRRIRSAVRSVVRRSAATKCCRRR